MNGVCHRCKADDVPVRVNSDGDKIGFYCRRCYDKIGDPYMRFSSLDDLKKDLGKD
jgi:tRNA(Ile2) C34 agmatinyltransferase TiaS